MNKHDSERMCGLLEASGLSRVNDPADADIIVFNTCCVRESADERLYGQVASLRTLEREGGRGPIIAVGGCIGQRDGQELLRRLPNVDVVFGTHNIPHLPGLLDAAERARAPVVEVLAGTDHFTSDLPSAREHDWHAWVPVTIGCDNACSYCVVPQVRGRERSRTLEEVIAECERLADEGVVEVTLLGQNVNSYGRDLYGLPRFAELLAATAETGVQHIRFATSHPKDLSPDTIEVMASTPGICRYLHLPVQAGSDGILRAMNRGYTRDDYLALVEQLYDAIPDLALSTDVIVGFPGETEADFVDTLAVVETAEFDHAFTFIYSPREGTPAASLPGRVSREETHDRFSRLTDAVRASALRKNLAYVGTEHRILVEGPSKRDPQVLTGRTDTNKLVHAPVPDGSDAETLSGTHADVIVEEAHSWFLVGRLRG